MAFKTGIRFSIWEALMLAVLSMCCDKAPRQAISPGQQGARLYPNYNTAPLPPDTTGMSMTAAQLVANIKLGWNLGNSLEATGGETAWGNPMVTGDLVKFVKQCGFNAIRIPCSWNQYADQATAKIQASWLARVKQVVQYCVDNGMYVILDIHWDGGWLEDNCTPAKQDSVNAKQRAFWEQIATYMRDFDEHLVFASANEPAVSDATQMSVLLSYHQTFINAVRSTGGKNAYRVLDIQGPSADIGKTVQLFTTMPVDSLPGKLMLEVHWYAPYQFTLMTQDASWGNAFYYWGQGHLSATDTPHNATPGNQESLVDLNFASMKDNFVGKGIPVIIGEFDAIRRTSLTGDSLVLSLASRAYFFKYVVREATAMGLAPFYWDNGDGVINRTNNTVLDPQALDSLLAGLTQ